ncbi:MAG: RlmE family RNA methyltransferase [Myxococcales bacterium]|nr:RlmE family RNA methyltransferase [Myxococcales bacterium]
MGRRRRNNNPYKKADAFTRRAQEEGYAARSVYKLQEIQRRLQPLRRGMRVVDLGCAPGSWWAYAAQCVGPQGSVVGVDITHSDVQAGPFLQQSIFDLTPEILEEAAGGPLGAVLSDMAPRTTGDPFGDHVRQLELARRALHVAIHTLEPGGHFVCKVFDGEEAHPFVMEVRSHFERVKRVRPEAVRRNSREFFVTALSFTPP